MFRIEDKNEKKLNIGDRVKARVTLSREQEGILTALGTPMSEFLPDGAMKSVLVLNNRIELIGS